MKRDVVFCNGYLRRYLNRLLSQLMTVFKSINQWNLEIKARAHSPVILLESVNKYSVLFAHKYSKSKIDVTSLESDTFILAGLSRESA